MDADEHTQPPDWPPPGPHHWTIAKSDSAENGWLFTSGEAVLARTNDGRPTLVSTTVTIDPRGRWSPEELAGVTLLDVLEAAAQEAAYTSVHGESSQQTAHRLRAATAREALRLAIASGELPPGVVRALPPPPPEYDPGWATLDSNWEAAGVTARAKTRRRNRKKTPELLEAVLRWHAEGGVELIRKNLGDDKYGPASVRSARRWLADARAYKAKGHL